MTVPVLAITAIALQTASQVASYQQQQAIFKAQSDYQHSQSQLTQSLARRSAAQRLTFIRQQQTEQRRSSAREINRVVLESQRAAGLARVGAAEAGSSGSSINMILSDFGRQQADFVSGVLEQEAFSDAQAEAQVQSTGLSLEGRILAARPKPLAPPSFAALLLQIGGSVLQGLAQTSSVNKETGEIDFFSEF